MRFAASRNGSGSLAGSASTSGASGTFTTRCVTSDGNGRCTGRRSSQRLVASDDAIQEAHAVSGAADYLLKGGAGNLEQLADFVTNTLLVNDTVSHVQSYVVLKQMKQTRPLPIRR